jgi:hypothetical protein
MGIVQGSKSVGRVGAPRFDYQTPGVPSVVYNRFEGNSETWK